MIPIRNNTNYKAISFYVGLLLDKHSHPFLYIQSYGTSTTFPNVPQFTSVVRKNTKL